MDGRIDGIDKLDYYLFLMQNFRIYLFGKGDEDGAAFDAYKLYYERTDLRYHFADESDEAILKMIETSPYGRCVYACGNDSVHHQTVLMEYEGGLTIILEMESYSQQRTRITHFYGTRGEVIADEKKIQISINAIECSHKSLRKQTII